MERFMVFLKSHMKLSVILVICIIMFSYYITQRKVQAEQPINITPNPIIDNMKLITTMFPEQKFKQQGKYFSAGERKNFYIESLIPGTFVKEGNDELLVIVRRPSDELSHVEGFYNAYMAVFDNSSGKMISKVKLFSTDEGSYHIFDSQGISYIFFAGSRTYQGWSNWYGGLWKAESDWFMKWPKNVENKEYNDYWENRAVEVNTSGIKILQRKTLPIKNKGQVMPDYTWEYSETLIWDKQSGSFILGK